MKPSETPATVIEPGSLQRLLDQLAADGHTVIGPRVTDGAVVYEPLNSLDQLPIGLRDEQAGGRYRLHPAGRPALFDHVVGPHSWKRWLFPPQQRLWRALRDGDGFRVEAEPISAPRYAFFGVRPCEIKAIQVQDRVFDNAQFSDPGYQARRADALIIAVNCARPAATCFCTSMDSGPRVDTPSESAGDGGDEGGYDLVISELFDGGEHRLLVEAGSRAGLELQQALAGRAADERDHAASRQLSRDAAAAIGRHMPADVGPMIERKLQHPHWDEVAGRCLSCGNCTLVCPTCFCTTNEDRTALDGDSAEHWRQWDSCFSADFSYIHGGSIRNSGSARYRQWMTHKLAHWQHQFGSSGCVGCGRCITWCPVGIDITAEAHALANGEET